MNDSRAKDYETVKEQHKKIESKLYHFRMN